MVGQRFLLNRWPFITWQMQVIWLAPSRSREVVSWTQMTIVAPPCALFDDIKEGCQVSPICCTTGLPFQAPFVVPQASHVKLHTLYCATASLGMPCPMCSSPIHCASLAPQSHPCCMPLFSMLQLHPFLSTASPTVARVEITTCKF